VKFAWVVANVVSQSTGLALPAFSSSSAMLWSIFRVGNERRFTCLFRRRDDPLVELPNMVGDLREVALGLALSLSHSLFLFFAG
jgi:hypothetical protein